VSLASWSVSTFYGCIIAENKAEIYFDALWKMILANGIQSLLVIVNNSNAQMPETEDMLVRRFQQVKPRSKALALTSTNSCMERLLHLIRDFFIYVFNAIRSVSNTKAVLHLISDFFIYIGNAIQSASNIGQVYVIATALDLDTPSAFYTAISLGSLIAIVNYSVYKTFRMDPAREEADIYIDWAVDYLNDCFSALNTRVRAACHTSASSDDGSSTSFNGDRSSFDQFNHSSTRPFLHAGIGGHEVALELSANNAYYEGKSPEA
jgi:hypothetical protein